MLAKKSPLCLNNPIRKEATAPAPSQFWDFRPDIGLPNIKEKLPEKRSNIVIAGQIDLLINGWG